MKRTEKPHHDNSRTKGRKWKKLTSALLSAALLTSTLAGCSGGSGDNAGSGSARQAAAPQGTPEQASGSLSGTAKAPEGARVIVFWHCMGGNIGEAVEDIVNDFNSSQSEIYVQSEYQGAYDDALTKLKAAMPAGNAPDVVQMFELGTRYLADSGFAIPIEDMLAEDPVVSMEDLEPILVNYYTLDGKFQCMPFNPSTPIMYYNKTAFSEAGLDPENPPRTFAEIEEIGEKLIKKDGGRITQYPFALFIYGWFFENFIAGMGELYADNDNGRTDRATAVVYDQNGSARTIMETWKRLVDKEIIVNYGRSGDDCRNAFIAGQAAMTLASTANLSAILEGVGDRFEVGTAYLPMMGGSSQEGGVIIGGGNLWLLDNEDEQKVKDAWEFIKYATSPEVAAEFSRKTGYFCANKNAYETEEMKAYLQENPNFQTAIDQLHDTPLNYATQGASLGVFSEIRATFEQNMELVLQNGQSVDEAISAMAESANEAIANYNATVRQ